MWCFVFVYQYFSCVFFFFKQKTAYEMRISDWSSDLCSSDLIGVVDPIIVRLEQFRIGRRGGQVESELALIGRAISDLQPERQLIGGEQAARIDRKSVV